METRNTNLPGMSPTRQALLRLPLLYPPVGQTASDTRRQSVWEDNIKARACFRPFLESCHLRSGLDTPVAKPPHFHRMGFIWSGDLCSSSGRNHQRKDSWLQEQIRRYVPQNKENKGELVIYVQWKSVIIKPDGLEE